MTARMQTWFLLAIGGLGGLLYGIDCGVIAVSMPYIKALKIYTDAEVKIHGDRPHETLENIASSGVCPQQAPRKVHS